MRYLLNENNEFCGIDYLNEGLDTPLKPLRDGEKAVWNGTEWEYSFKEVPKYKEYPEEGEVLEVFAQIQWCISPSGGQKDIPKEKDISVLIPCYGKAEWIVETVTSCLEQTMLPYKVKVLLMDDDSIALKDTLEALSTLVECEVHERLNASASRNYLVEQCETEYFILLDADDKLGENFIEEVYSQDASIVFPECKGDGVQFIMRGVGTLFTYCAWQNLTALFCKTAWNELGGLDEDLCLGGEDGDFIVRLFASDWRIKKTFDTYYWYNTKSQGLAFKEGFYESHFRMLKKHLAFYRKQIRRWLYRKDWFYFFLMDDNNFTDLKTLCSAYRVQSGSPCETRKRLSALLELYRESRERVSGVFNNQAVDCFIHGTLSQETMDTGEGIEFEMRDGVTIQGSTFYEKLEWLLSNYCCFIDEIRLKDMESKINETQGDVINRPMAFMLNKLCNRECEYCNQAGWQDYKVFGDDEIFARFDKMLTKAEKVGHLQIQILGGEPTLWSDYLIKKLLDRMKDYPRIMIMSNHDNKSSYWEKDSRAYFYNHLVDWHGKRVHATGGDKYMIVLCHDDVPYLEEFFELNQDTTIHVSEYNGKIDRLLLTQEDRDIIMGLKAKYFQMNILVNEKPLNDDEEAHEKCRLEINPWQANCLDMVFRSCCGCDQPKIPFDKWTGQLPDKDCCAGCNTVWTEIQP